MKTVYTLTIPQLDNIELINSMVELSEDDILYQNVTHFWNILHHKLKSHYFVDNIEYFYEFIKSLNSNQYDEVQQLILQNKYVELDEFLFKYIDETLTDNSISDNSFLTFLQLLKTKNEMVIYELENNTFIGGTNKKEITNYIDNSTSIIIVDDFKIKKNIFSSYYVYITKNYKST